MKNKIIGIFVCMLMMTTCVVPVSSTISQSDEKKSSPLEIPDSYIIENVPYVSQGDTWYCAFATATMIFQYYGINTSLFEVLFNSGVGYSAGYQITWPCVISPGAFLCQITKDRQFLADIYGLNFSYWYCNDESVSDENRWQMYWTNVKENISQNIPVIAGVMLEDLPYIPYEPGGHVILLVGFNEANNTVCLHDSYAGVVNKSINGDYIYLPIDVLKESTKSIDDRFYFEIFEKTSHTPKSKKEAFELAHSRNIQKMKGDAKVYPKFCWVPICGIHALIFFKHSNTIRNLPISNFIRKINEDYDYLFVYECNMLYLEKHNMSQYLIEHADLYQNALYEAELLDIEAKNWLFLDFKHMELQSTPIFRIPAKILLLKEIRDILDVIISIEKDIIAGSP